MLHCLFQCRIYATVCVYLLQQDFMHRDHFEPRQSNVGVLCARPHLIFSLYLQGGGGQDCQGIWPH